MLGKVILLFTFLTVTDAWYTQTTEPYRRKSTTNYTSPSKTWWKTTSYYNPTSYRGSLRNVSFRFPYGGHSGELEVYHNGVWGKVCSSGMTYREATTICRSMRFHDVSYFTKGGSARLDAILSNIHCNGYDNVMLHCYGDWTRTCLYKVYLSCLEYTTTPDQTTEMTTTDTNGTSFVVDHYLRVYCNDNGWDISLYLPPLYREYSDFTPSDIYLGTDTCTGNVNGNFMYFRQDYTQCGTQVTATLQSIVYTGELKYAVHDPVRHFRKREHRFRVKVDCHMPRQEGASGNINHGTTNPLDGHDINGSSHHSVNLEFFTDPSFAHPTYAYGSKVGENVYVKAYTDIRNDDIKMHLDSCYTTPSYYSSESYRYYIIRDGCVIDRNARFISQTTHETRFVFQDFEYAGNHASLYLFCNATFCNSRDFSGACDQRCRHLGKRDLAEVESDSDQTGPLEIVEVGKLVRAQKGHRTEKRWSGYSKVLSNQPESRIELQGPIVAIVSVFGVIGIMLTVIVLRLKRRKARNAVNLM